MDGDNGGARRTARAARIIEEDEGEGESESEGGGVRYNVCDGVRCNVCDGVAGVAKACAGVAGVRGADGSSAFSRWWRASTRRDEEYARRRISTHSRRGSCESCGAARPSLSVRVEATPAPAGRHSTSPHQPPSPPPGGGAEPAREKLSRSNTSFL